MKVAVRYYTKSGNTEKLAAAIAEAVGVDAQDVSVPLSEDVDILFLGSSVYAAGVDPAVKLFISNLQVEVGKVVNFSTAAILKSTYKQVKKLLDAKGIPLAEEEYACKGSFGPMNRNKPDDKNLEEAAEFAKAVVAKG